MALSWEERLDLQELMVRYARAIDIDDSEQEFLEIFTPDAVLDSPVSGHNEGLGGLKNFFARILENRKEYRIRHYITNFLIDGNSDRATIKAYFTELLTPNKPLPHRRNRESEFLFAGTYDCTARKIGGKWKIDRRTVSVDDR